MKLDFGKTELKIDVTFAAAVTLTLILDESGIGALALFCCIIHEFGHIVCLLLLGEKPKSVTLSFYGIKLERSGEYWGRARETAVYASGPVMNFLMALLMLQFGEKTKNALMLSLLIGAFNLIPCRPLDGGNLLFLWLGGRMSEEKADKLCFAISCVTVAPLATAGMAVLPKTGNATLLGVSLYLSAAIFLDKKEKDRVKL
ncbi:MAG: M50 family metallopeptidase [Clostridia bacterium]|nr:M50 family metallopeptidase [Clostridia bacterium]